jgi:hypothetical protein
VRSFFLSLSVASEEEKVLMTVMSITVTSFSPVTTSSSSRRFGRSASNFTLVS